MIFQMIFQSKIQFKVGGDAAISKRRKLIGEYAKFMLSYHFVYS